MHFKNFHEIKILCSSDRLSFISWNISLEIPVRSTMILQ